MSNDKSFLGLFEKQSTVIIGIVLGTASFFWGVIIPIQKIQVQLAQIQIQLEENKESLNTITQKNIDQDKEIDHLVQDIKNLK